MAGQRWDMSQRAFDPAAKGTAGRTQDLGGLVTQLVNAAVPLEGKFAGEGKQFDVVCDHSVRGGWQHRSAHRTSDGVVGYARCSCGEWLVLLDGDLLATAGGPGC